LEKEQALEVWCVQAKIEQEQLELVQQLRGRLQEQELELIQEQQIPMTKINISKLQKGERTVKFLNAAISASLSAIMATRVPTLTPFDPSGRRILAMYPSSTDSKSTVALSVSTSARTSPGLTLSPSFFRHLARLPSFMVGDNAGMVSLIWAGSEAMHLDQYKLNRVYMMKTTILEWERLSLIRLEVP
jgi:hypothetical protein